VLRSPLPRLLRILHDLWVGLLGLVLILRGLLVSLILFFSLLHSLVFGLLFVLFVLQLGLTFTFLGLTRPTQPSNAIRLQIR
jgi:hypothetical protein